MGHRGKLGGALVLTFLLLGCLAVSYSFSWYRIKVTFPTMSGNQSDLDTYADYFWTKFRITNAVSDHEVETDYGDSTKDIKQVFTVSLSFLSASAAAAVAVAIFQIIGIIARSRFFRILAGIGGLVSFALLAVAFFTFFGITKAFDKDNQCIGAPSKDNYCKSFYGSADNLLNAEYKWMPYIGWWVGVGGLAFSLLTAIASFLA
ncbi:transmembrane protein [Heterostelium album PN500]|uniref:Transmembrane protein n=1 Tax=Heterostelium pallidum (strain ATCC 26659 / Pp 5 / PN500) TaxID=670386 RepID=D3BPW0_HETP5|nr:transmembrane protein [Heterostelium album PN500]EFA76243.1 transmembrane protein [Heterostelium album PN500]|eukprot:XP_020428376.1 transmembrane protein [Heterostelium album PN500]